MKKQTLQLSMLIFIVLTAICVKTNAQASWKLTGNTGIVDTSNFLGTTDQNPIIFKTRGIEQMRIQSSGKVGIGTKKPGSDLNIATNAVVSLTTPGMLMLGDDKKSNMTMDNNVIQSRYNGTAASLYLNYYGGTTYVGPTAALQVSSTGTALAAGNFSFNSSSQSLQFPNPSGTPAAMMYMFASGTTNINRMVIAHSASYSTWGLQYDDTHDQFDFLGAGASRMSINLSNGNIGIGVATPVYRLEVCGTIRAKEVRVETGWCDYVFEKDYKLKSLNELEQYINDNKHLPGIVPASEVEKNGLKLAEMNKAMMEKIEELTLYVIQLSKDNQKLQQEIDALKK